jgi:hypothetical protein
MAQFGVEIPGELEKAWARCKKVTGTLVTLKRLASVQVLPPPPYIYEYVHK